LNHNPSDLLGAPRFLAQKIFLAQHFEIFFAATPVHRASTDSSNRIEDHTDEQPSLTRRFPTTTITRRDRWRSTQASPSTHRGSVHIRSD
jgi:hypothetical protein